MTRPTRRVAVIFGGPSPEHDVSVLTGLQALRALSSLSEFEDPRALFWSKTGAFFEVAPLLEAKDFADGAPSGARPLDLVVSEGGGFVARSRLGSGRRLEIEAAVICCHGGPGEDGSLQGALDCAGIAYTGPTSSSAALGMDKLASCGVLSADGLPVLPRMLLDPGTREPDFAGPYIVKPRFGGSSIGIDVVKDFSTAQGRLATNQHLRRGAVLEPYRDDLFDLEIAVRTWPELSLSEIARPQVRDETAEILDYTDKYSGGEGMLSAPRELPAKLDEKVAEELRAIARRAASLLGARGVNRIDFLSDGGSLYVNEINTIPGSLGRYLFINPPLPFGELLRAMVDEAIARPAMAFNSAGADGSVLREAGAIASKLA